MFKEFERWLLSSAVATEDVFAELTRYAEIYDLIDDHPLHGVEGRFLYRMKVLQTSTPMPLLLFLFGLEESVLPPERRRRAIRAIDSYLVRRAVLNLSTRDYNNVFRELVTAVARQPDRADEAVIDALSAMQGHHRHWPNSSEFRASLEQDPIYSRLVRRSVRILLEALEDELRTDHTEQLTVPVGEQAGAKLTIEHVMPQSWRDNWPPLEGDLSEGADRDELVHTRQPDPGHRPSEPHSGQHGLGGQTTVAR
ncbi:HNH endonuclease family protein [Streptomyces ossamyceticus]|uniref:HNH endonuclease family protein n=1 Tax=Streptomyces ossamyceticus TaxID=249581 RepID=UPI0006E31D5C|nr:HNH endonuclease family protein [Streptomyces ossamyceticus]